MDLQNGVKRASLPLVDAKAFASVESLAEEVIKGLKDAGACIIKQLYDESTMSKMDKEIEPYLTAENSLRCKFVTFWDLKTVC